MSNTTVKTFIASTSAYSNTETGTVYVGRRSDIFSPKCTSRCNSKSSIPKFCIKSYLIICIFALIATHRCWTNTEDDNHLCEQLMSKDTEGMTSKHFPALSLVQYPLSWTESGRVESSERCQGQQELSEVAKGRLETMWAWMAQRPWWHRTWKRLRY